MLSRKSSFLKDTKKKESASFKSPLCRESVLAYADLKGYLRKNGKTSPGDQYFKQLTYKQINNIVYGLLNVTCLQTDNNKLVGEVDMIAITRIVADFVGFGNTST